MRVSRLPSDLVVPETHKLCVMLSTSVLQEHFQMSRAAS